MRANGSYTRSYVESIRENTVDGETTETGSYNRGNSLYVTVGVGLGRARNVAPLIRAQRLSERLKAIGRAPLSPAEIQEVARVLATEHGYRAVYERPDRSFWQDVLMPMLDEGEVIDRTASAMGGRCLRRWVAAPLRDIDLIRQRQDAIADLLGDPHLHQRPPLAVLIFRVTEDLFGVLARCNQQISRQAGHRFFEIVQGIKANTCCHSGIL
mgnify:CR=1 FL=1